MLIAVLDDIRQTAASAWHTYRMNTFGRLRSRAKQPAADYCVAPVDIRQEAQTAVFGGAGGVADVEGNGPA